MSINELVKPNAFDVFKKSVSETKKKSLASKSAINSMQYEYIGTEVLRSYLDGQTVYTVAIRDVNNKDDDYDLNLMIKESLTGTSTYIIKYSKLDNSVIIHPVNSTQANKELKSTNSISSTVCTTYRWEVTTPCSCEGHTSGSCCCGTYTPGTRYRTSSGSTTTCYNEPLEITELPGGGGGGRLSGNGFGDAPGIPGTNGFPEPIYIYEGKEECDDQGNCTPLLYWAQAQAADSIQNINLDNGFDEEIITSNTNFNLNSIGTNKINPNEELKCFDLTKEAKLTVYVQQPTENTNEIVSRENGPGHAFIGLEQNGIIRQIGFYPESSANEIFVGVGIDHDSELRDNNYLYHVSISKNISSTQLTSISDYIKNFPKIYNVNNYACTDFAIKIGNIGGMKLPSTSVSSLTFEGRSPGKLGQEIRFMNSDSTKTINKNKSNSPNKEGTCN